MSFKEEVLSTVKRIPKGKVMTYRKENFRKEGVRNLR